MRKNRWMVCVMGILLLGLSLWVWLKPAGAFSDSERRALAQFPSWGEDFSEDFETYAQDQFPLRDAFRSVKAFTSLKLMRQMDNNGLYVKDGHISRLDPTLNESQLEHAASRFLHLQDLYLEDANVYFSIVPDKNYFLTEDMPAYDYTSLVSYMQKVLPEFSYIDIFPLLSIEDYYRTDSHWRQECVQDVAAQLGAAMGVTLEDTYETVTATANFRGVYYGQLALPMEADVLNYVTNDMLEQCVATSYDSGVAAEASLYRLSAVNDKDPYTLFPDDAVFVMENPSAATDHELVLFRDSFGGSLAPYFCEAYAKVTLVDIRYVDPALLGQWISFDNCDVLFLYSTTMLNSSSALR